MGSSRSFAGLRPDPAGSRWENDAKALIMESRKIWEDLGILGQFFLECIRAKSSPSLGKCVLRQVLTYLPKRCIFPSRSMVWI